MFAFSTCWNSDSHTDGEVMMDEIRGLGFTLVELSHGIRLSLVEGIQKALAKHPDLRISSLHNFCPLPVGFMHAAPNAYLLSAASDKERQKAIRHTLTTIDFAAKLKARFVVLHLGSVDMGEYTRDLVKMLRAGERDTPAYRKLLDKALVRRKSRGAKPFALAVQSLQEIAKAAGDRGIRLGIECRYRLEEMPNQAEFDELLYTFPATQVGYWHDSGHAQTWHNLGIADHVRWLGRFESRILGCHLHDVTWPDRDHQLPGEGMVPFDKLDVLHRPNLLKVFEFEPGMPAEALRSRLPGFMSSFETAGRG